MNQEVKRYDPFGYDGLSALMREDEYGDWVRVEDYDALLAERDALKKDAERLDRLDIECVAYGCEGIHEGNRWMIDGPFRSVRDAIDAALQGEQP